MAQLRIQEIKAFINSRQVKDLCVVASHTWNQLLTSDLWGLMEQILSRLSSWMLWTRSLQSFTSEWTTVFTMFHQQLKTGLFSANCSYGLCKRHQVCTSLPVPSWLYTGKVSNIRKLEENWHSSLRVLGMVLRRFCKSCSFKGKTQNKVSTSRHPNQDIVITEGNVYAEGKFALFVWTHFWLAGSALTRMSFLQSFWTTEQPTPLYLEIQSGWSAPGPG